MTVSIPKRIFVLLLSFSSLAAAAGIETPYFFSSHMVLQREKPIRIWGKATAGEKLTAVLHNQTQATTANGQGEWSFNLAPEAAGGPYTLVIHGQSDSLILSDILVGEVWVCSGQSNMEWPLSAAQNAQAEIAQANNSNIRQFKVPNRVAFAPQSNTLPAAWTVCSPATAGTFSAVAYFFARKLYNELKVPIGLVNSTWGGTVAEAWTSKASLELHPDFAALAKSAPVSEAAYAAARLKRFESLVQKFQGAASTTSDALWKTAAYDDSRWPFVAVNKFWEEQGLPDFDGTVWYRTEVSLTPQQAAKTATLALGTIDDDDSTFINGELVGATQLWNADRQYKLKPGLFKAGKNSIAVKVVDNGGGGGLYGNSERAVILDGGEKLALPPTWKAQVSTARSVATSNPNELLSSLYNGMIFPLIPLSMRGVIWYQGESNASRASQYETLFPLMIKDWRKAWGAGNFPFYFVQLSSFDPVHKAAGSPSEWADLREAQRKTLALPATGMVVTTDIGARDDIHPRNKQDVGLRLALLALNKTYGKQVVFSGPTLKNIRETPEGLVLSFATNGSALQLKNGDVVRGFDAFDENGRVTELTGRITGDDVVVTVPSTFKPQSLKYAWRDDAGAANLFNREGLPALPFAITLTTKK